MRKYAVEINFFHLLNYKTKNKIFWHNKLKDMRISENLIVILNIGVFSQLR